MHFSLDDLEINAPSPQPLIDPLQHRRAGAQLALAKSIERRGHGVEMGVQVARLRIDVEQAGDDYALGLMRLQVVHGDDAVVSVVVGVQLVQAQDAAVVLFDLDGVAVGVIDGDFRARRHDVEAVDGLVVLAHVFVALGAAGVVVEGDAGADHVDEGGALVRDRGLDQRHQLALVAGEAARDEAGAQHQRHADHVQRTVGVGHAFLRHRARVGGGRELALGQAVHAVVLDDVGHVDAAAHDVGELAQADRGGVAVAGHAEIEQAAVGEVGAGQHRGHAPVHGVEAVRLAEEIIRRLAAAADAGELSDAVRLDVQLPAGLDDRRRDRVVAAAGAQGGHLALVVTAGVADGVAGQGGVVQFRLGDVGHAAPGSGRARGCVR